MDVLPSHSFHSLYGKTPVLPDSWSLHRIFSLMPKPHRQTPICNYMRHNELLNLHALLREIRHDMEKHGDVNQDAFAAYDYQETRPMHLHRNKQEHKRAIRLLLWGIIRSIEAESDLGVVLR